MQVFGWRTDTDANPEEYPLDVAVMNAGPPGLDVVKVPSTKIDPAGIVRDWVAREAMLEFEELRNTGIGVIAFEGSPAWSTTSTLTVPLL